MRALLLILMAAGAGAPDAADPLGKALKVEAERCPALDPAKAEAFLQPLLEGARRRLSEGSPPDALLRYLTQERGFSAIDPGTDPGAFSLWRVLHQGRGAGEILAVLYAALARRLDQEVAFCYAPDRLLLRHAGVLVDMTEKTAGLTEAAYRKKLGLPSEGGPYLDAMGPEALEAFLRRRRAEVLLAAGRPEEALGDAERAVALDDTRAEHHAVLGRTRWTLADPEGARRELAKARAANPASLLADWLEADLLAGEGKAAEALERYQSALARTGAPAGTLSGIHRALGRLRERQHLPDLALADYQKAAKLGGSGAGAVLDRERSALSVLLHASSASAMAPAPADELGRLLSESRSPSPAKREEAQKRLAEMGPRALPAVRQALRDGNAEARLGALLFLSGHPTPLCLAELEACLTREEPAVRLAACTALGALADASPGRPELFQGLRERLSDADAEVRRKAATVLARHKDAGVLPFFREALRDANAENRRQAVMVLGRMGDQASVPQLTGILQDPHPRVRSRAAQSLGLLKALQAVPDLIRSMSDEDRDVRQEAMTALARITRQNFGSDPAPWEAWWKAQAGEGAP